MSKVSVKDRVVFVTGANRENGIGHALVVEAVRRGAKKVYATARNASQLDKLVAQSSGKVVAVELDVTNLKQIQKAAQAAGDTQILINNAGMIGFSGCMDKYNEEVARQEMEVNFWSPLHLMHAFSENLVKNNPAAIVNIISIAALMPFPQAATYSASKAALYSATGAARMEMAPHGIPVFGVYPGPIDTDMAGSLDIKKESPANVAIRIFDGMQNGLEDITTDAMADAFKDSLKMDSKAVEAVMKEFG